MVLRRLATVAIASTLAVAGLLSWGASRATVLAHCPGTAAHDYSYGNQSPGLNMNAIAADIDWTQGNVCTSGVSHSVTICATGACGAWVQVGWRYYAWYAEPKMYCEYAGGTYKIVEFTISHATHRYQQRYDSSDGFWRCFLDGSPKFAYDVDLAGMNKGTYLTAQGENHQKHVQIGRMWGATLLFADMQYRKASDGNWPAVNVVLISPPSPYGNSEPAVGQMRVWTNAH